MNDWYKTLLAYFQGMGKSQVNLVLLALVTLLSLFGTETRFRNLRESLKTDPIESHQLTVCLNTTYGRNFNQIITLANAIHYAEKLDAVLVLADEGWNHFYRLWFKDPTPKIRLRPKGFPCDITQTAEALYWSRTLSFVGTEPHVLFRPQYNHLQLRIDFLARARDILNEYRKGPNGTVVTVHQRWLEGECYERHQQPNCCFGNSQFNFTCEYTADIVQKYLPPEYRNATVVLMGDGQRKEAERTFENIDKHSFHIQAAIMVESDYHMGNPVSSIDGVIAHWRKGRKQFPEVCYDTITSRAGMFVQRNSFV